MSQTVTTSPHHRRSGCGGGGGGREKKKAWRSREQQMTGKTNAPRLNGANNDRGRGDVKPSTHIERGIPSLSRERQKKKENEASVLPCSQRRRVQTLSPVNFAPSPSTFPLCSSLLYLPCEHNTAAGAAAAAQEEEEEEERWGGEEEEKEASSPSARLVVVGE